SLERPKHLFTLSAKNDSALQALAQRYDTYLQSNSEDTLANIGFTANTGRTHFNHRLAIIADSTIQLREQLSAFNKSPRSIGFKGVLKSNHKPPKIAFLFTGQGSQYVGMGRELYETQPSFRQTLERCDDILRPYLEKPLIEVLYHEASPQEERQILISRQFSLNETVYTQPALFSLEYALVELWKSWGIKPSVVMGHSLGEYVAACVAGVFSLEDGLKLIAKRARLMQSLPSEGEMLTVMADEERVITACQSYPQAVSIAAINEPNHSVISGQSQAIQAVRATLEADGITTYPLNISQGAHSPLIKSILTDFETLISEVNYSTPQLEIISNLTGQLVTDEITTPEYWLRHLLEPVRFATGIETLHQLDYDIFLEIGPKPTLLDMGQQCLPEKTGLWLPSLRQWQSDWQQLLKSLGQLYLHGVTVDWSGFDQDYPRQRVVLPTYPFQRRHYWFQPPKNRVMTTQTLPFDNISMTQTRSQSSTTRKDQILGLIRSFMAESLQETPSEVAVDVPLLEMGADSIVIVRAMRKIETQFGLTLTVRQFFEELNTLEALATHIDQQLPSEAALTDSPPREAQPPLTNDVDHHLLISGNQELAKTAPDTVLERILSQQIQAMSQQTQALSQQTQTMFQQTQAMSQLMSQQLDVLRGTQEGTGKEQWKKGRKNDSRNKVELPISDSDNKVSESENQSEYSTNSNSKSSRVMPAWGRPEIHSKGLSPQQQRHLESLIARYTKRTQKSKQQEQAYRSVFADMRSTFGFRMETKEICYPIIAESFQGSKMWDIDDNEYIDLTMGFGVHLFGHQPDFITTALEYPLKRGMSLGPQSKLAGEVAELICEFTGMQRVTFCNSGTEAVMTALRIARAATGREKIILFSGSYHGHFDGTLAVSPIEEPQLGAVPMAPGVLQKMVDDILVLPYGVPQSLNTIKTYANELAAVLVEPVQSRRPDLQPKAFLHELREITKAADTALIFDEMITGFRIHPGGVQALFGVDADIVTYGKVIGGGMPLGIVAGKADYMAKIDGGLWRYGDASHPEIEKTFYAGTFCKHPLAMVAARAVLNCLKKQGPVLQQKLNQRTTYLAKTLNTYFEQSEVPIRVVYFGSLFRFALANNLSYVYQPLEMDLLFYHLIEKGVYIWEGRVCFLSTAHTAEDIEYIIKVVKESVEELRKGGFLPPNPAPTGNKTNGKSHSQSTSAGSPTTLNVSNGTLSVTHTPKMPLTEAQKQLWVLSQIGDEGSIAYNVSLSLQLQGHFELAAMRQAVQQVVNRHDALRTVMSRDGDFQQCLPSVSIEVPVVDLSGNLAQERDSTVTSFLEQESCQPFNLAQGPLIRVHLVKLEEDLHLLVLTAHHIVVDGLSMNLIIQEMGAFYSAACQRITCQLEAPLEFCDYVGWQTQQIKTTEMATQEAYWRDKFAESIPVLNLPTDHPYPPIRSYKGSRQTVRLPAWLCQNLKALSQKQGCTPFMTYLSAYTIWLYRITGQNDILVGIPVAGRNLEGSDNLVGYCTHLLPIRTYIAGDEAFLAYLQTLRGILLDAYEHQDYPFAHLINKLKLQRDSSHTPLVSVTFNLDKPSERPKLFELEVEWFSQPLHFTAFDISINLTDIGEELVLDCDYNTDLFNATT
ncbi:MAG: non-ribosomal peptide synthetase, partial [Candidatus Parabeggiatoa sp. nov. 1]